MIKELAGICKDLRLLGDDELTKKALIAYSAVSNSESPSIDLSYSYILRKLRKGDEDKRLKFQKVFKEAFDRALYADLEDPSSIALLTAIKAIGYNQEKDA